MSSALDWRLSTGDDVRVEMKSRIKSLFQTSINVNQSNLTESVLTNVVDIIEQSLFTNSNLFVDYSGNNKNLKKRVNKITKQLKSEYIKNNNRTNTNINTTLTQQEIAQTMSGEMHTTTLLYDIDDLDRMLSILNNTNRTSNATATSSNTLTNNVNSNCNKHATIIIDDSDDEGVTTSSQSNKINIGHNSDPASLPMDVTGTDGDSEVMHIEMPVEIDPVKEANDKLREGNICYICHDNNCL